MYGVKEIGISESLRLINSQWWNLASPREIAKKQLLVKEPCVPLDVFMMALSESLDREVFVFEMAFGRDQLQMEFFGEKDPPSEEDIVMLLPLKQRTELSSKRKEGETILDVIRREGKRKTQ